MVAGSAVACRLLFLWWSGPRAISADLRGWELVVRVLSAGQNPYQTTTVLNWPPLWMQILFALGRLASTISLPVILVIRLFLIAAEIGLLAATDRLMARLHTPRRRLLLLAGFALNPVCVLLTVQHGNFDCLVALAIILSLGWLIDFLEEGDGGSWLLSAVFLGLAITFKTAPVVLAPLLAAKARRLPRAVRISGGLFVAGPALYGFSVLYALTPEAVRRNILGYRSISGWFGVTGVLHLFRLDAEIPWYGLLFATAILAGAALLGAALWRRAEVTVREVLLLGLLLLIAIPFLGGGYGPQYFFWFWPLLLATAPLAGDAMCRSAGVFGGIAAVTYVVEYALMEVLGGFLIGKTDAVWVSLAALVLRSNRAAALLNAPLFAAYALLFGAILRALREARETRPVEA